MALEALEKTHEEQYHDFEVSAMKKKTIAMEFWKKTRKKETTALGALEKTMKKKIITLRFWPRGRRP